MTGKLKIKDSDFTEGNIVQKLPGFCFPIFVSHLCRELYTATNSLIVGNMVDSHSLAVVSGCSWLCSLFGYVFSGLGMGAGIYVARYYGEHNMEKLKRTMDTALLFAIIGGGIITVLSEIFLPQMMRILNIQEALYNDSLLYLRVYMLSNVAVLTYNMCIYILRSLGDSKNPLKYLILSSVINLGLGILFVGKFGMSIVGTSLASMISQYFVNILCMRLLLQNRKYGMDIKHIEFDFHILKEICKLGIPQSIQNSLISFANLTIQSAVNGLPADVISGIGAAQKITGGIQIVSLTFSDAGMSVISQNYGARKYDRVQHFIRFNIRISCLLTCLVIGMEMIFAGRLVSLFSMEPEVIRYGTLMVRYSAFGFLFINLSHIYNGACRCCGNVIAPMVIAIISQGLVPYMFLKLGAHFSDSMAIIYLATTVGYTVAGILAAAYFRTSRWTKNSLLRS